MTWKSGAGAILRYGGLWLGFALFMAVVAWNAPAFLSKGNLLDVLRQVAVTGTIALGVTFVVIAGRLDLSVGSGLTLLTILVVDQQNHAGPLGAILLTLGAGLLIGAWNGLLVGWLRFNALIVTLAMLSVLQGVALWYSGGANVSVAAPGWFAWFGRGSLMGVPAQVWIMLLFACLAAFLLTRSRLGRAIFAVGGNETAARYSGISAPRTVFLAYLLSGFATAIGAIIMGSRVMGAQSTIGQGYELNVLAGIILGGTSLMGGAGSIWRTIWGVLMLGLIQNGLILMGFPFYAQWLVTWVVIIAAVWIDLAAKRGRAFA